jgi:hypothetical protein
MPFRLGRLPSPHDPDRLRRARLFRAADFPAPPASYNWASAVKAPWGVMLNDAYGDCAVAAPAHLVMAWTAATRGDAAVIPDSVIKQVYFRISPRDQGCNMVDVLNYWASHTIGGHSILGYAPVNPADDAQCLTLGWLFGGLFAGAELPDGGTEGGVWKTPCAGDIGGHAFCPVADFTGGSETVVTWGQLWAMTPGFRRQRVDELYAVLSPDWFGANGLTPNGHTPSQMGAWLRAAGGHLLNPLPPDPSPAPAPVPTPSPTPAPGALTLGGGAPLDFTGTSPVAVRVEFAADDGTHFGGTAMVYPHRAGVYHSTVTVTRR